MFRSSTAFVLNIALYIVSISSYISSGFLIRRKLLSATFFLFAIAVIMKPSSMVPRTTAPSSVLFFRNFRASISPSVTAFLFLSMAAPTAGIVDVSTNSITSVAANNGHVFDILVFARYSNMLFVACPNKGTSVAPRNISPVLKLISLNHRSIAIPSANAISRYVLLSFSFSKYLCMA